MRILFVATKSPWPARDGGRLALWLTLQGLAEAGHSLALLAPERSAAADPSEYAPLQRICRCELLPSSPIHWPAALLGSARRGGAATVLRHHHPALAARLQQLIDEVRPEQIHVEQLQGWSHLRDVRSRPPSLLRMQNIESSLWKQWAERSVWRVPLRIEARRVAQSERDACGDAGRVLCLTDNDAEALRAIVAPTMRVRIAALAPPFPGRLPPGPALDGAPALALAGSAGWRPNRVGSQWFQQHVLPALQRVLPSAKLHVFGDDALPLPGVTAHPAPDDSALAFPAGAIAVIPLTVASGIRMRILEAWARGLPVVATRIAAAGLDVVDQRELLMADDAEQFVAAISRLHGDRALRIRLIEAGRDYLQQHHHPEHLTTQLLQHYRQCADGAAG